MMQVFNPNDPNVAMLECVARSLGPELCAQFVFVGGAAAGLLITDLAMPTIRRTDDVDIMTNAEALADCYRLEDQLRALGFVQDQSPDAPVCRWRVKGVSVDLMPTQEEIFGLCQPLVSRGRGHGPNADAAQRCAHPCAACARVHCHQAGGVLWARWWRFFVQP